MNTLHPDSIEALKTIRNRVTIEHTVVFVSGNFNILHPGHLRLLRFAKECGDYLVVGVCDQRHEGAVLPEETRLEAVSHTSWVDFAFLLRDPPENLIRELRPTVVVKGKEHEGRFNPEQKSVDAYKGQLLFSSGDSRFSSLDLLRSEFRSGQFPTLIKPTDFPQRHGFSLRDLAKVVEAFPSLRIGVIGDLIVDEYVTCDPLGMSQEDPTIVVTPLFAEKFLGGAAIVAAHARGLGAQVELFSVAGLDETAQFAKERIAHYGVSAHILEDESRPTTLKQRYRAGGKTLLRINTLRQHAISHQLIDDLLAKLEGTMPNLDLLIFSDFSYGALPKPLIDAATHLGKEHQVLLVADSQCSSQMGDITRFPGMKLVTPTEREARMSLKDFESGLVILAESLRQKTQVESVILTLGGEGVLIHAANNDLTSFETDRLPAFNQAPKDLAGAGDAFLVCSSMALALQKSIWESAYLGSLGAACQVSRVGNVPLTLQELLTELEPTLEATYDLA